MILCLEVVLWYVTEAVRPRRYVTSHRKSLWLRLVLKSCFSSDVWFTVSKALEKSKAMAIVRLGGFL